MADPRRQYIGRINKAHGEYFEKLISDSSDMYKELGIAYIEKTPEPFHITGKGKDGQVHGYYEKKGQPDFKGILRDGMGIIFEAKHTDTDRIRQDVVTEKQAESMDVYDLYGAHCFVLVSLNLESFYRVPWSKWKQMKALYGHKYMNREELEPYKIRMSQCKLLFLDGLELKE